MTSRFTNFGSAIVVAIVCSVATPLAAQTVEESILSQLSDQGFSEFETRRTLLGRIRIVAYGNGLIREIVINPTTGEILRDYWRKEDGDVAVPKLVDPSAQAVSSDDDDDDDDRDDDDRDDDDRDDDDRDDDRNDDDDDSDDDDEEDDDEEDDDDEDDDDDD